MVLILTRKKCEKCGRTKKKSAKKSHSRDCELFPKCTSCHKPNTNRRFDHSKNCSNFCIECKKNVTHSHNHTYDCVDHPEYNKCCGLFGRHGYTCKNHLEYKACCNYIFHNGFCLNHPEYKECCREYLCYALCPNHLGYNECCKSQYHKSDCPNDPFYNECCGSAA